MCGKLRMLSLGFVAAMFIVTTMMACSAQEEELQGVLVTDSGEVAVTFRVPDGMDVEDVLGHEIGQENSVSVSGSYIVYWYKVSEGGILSRCGDVYRYAPEATVSNQTGSTAPPAYAMLYSTPEESDILDSAAVDELAERYGITLYFNGGAPNTNATALVDTYSMEDLSVVYDVSAFHDGYCVVWGSLPNESSAAFSMDTSGNMKKMPAYNVTNFCKGTALAVTSINGGDYADAIVDTEGNTVWSIAEEGETAAIQYFDSGDVTDVGSPFDTEEAYHGYFPVVFDVDSFEYTGSYVGVLDGEGNWVVEPTPAYYYAWSTADYYIVTSTFILDYSTGEVTWFGDSATDSDADKARQELQSQIGLVGYLADHDGLVFGLSDIVPSSFDTSVQGFYDGDGNLVIDLSGYDLTESPEFNDGYALLEIRNEQMSDYLTIIDVNGDQILDPFKVRWYGTLSEGALFCGNDDSGYFDNDEAYFIDLEGNQIGALKGSKCVPFSEGLAWIYTSDGWKCIDKSGSEAF